MPGWIRTIAVTCFLAIAAGCTSTSVPELLPKGGEADRSEGDLPAACTIPENEAELVDRVLELVNQARSAEGLEPLVLDETLAQVAGDFGCEMIEEGFFSHENPTTKVNHGERLTAAGYIYYMMGENLAFGHSTPEEVFRDWMDSPSHRANILWPAWRELGMAVRTGGPHGWYWVQEYADPVEFAEN